MFPKQIRAPLHRWQLFVMLLFFLIVFLKLLFLRLSGISEFAQLSCSCLIVHYEFLALGHVGRPLLKCEVFITTCERVVSS